MTQPNETYDIVIKDSGFLDVYPGRAIKGDNGG